MMELRDITQYVDVLQPVEFEIAQHAIDEFAPLQSMGFHEFAFLLRKLAAFEENIIGYADFADIVQGREDKDILDVFIAELVSVGELVGDQARVARHAIQVGAGLVVPDVGHVTGGFDGRQQGMHRR